MILNHDDLISYKFVYLLAFDHSEDRSKTRKIKFSSLYPLIMIKYPLIVCKIDVENIFNIKMLFI